MHQACVTRPEAITQTALHETGRLNPERKCGSIFSGRRYWFECTQYWNIANLANAYTLRHLIFQYSGNILPFCCLLPFYRLNRPAKLNKKSSITYMGKCEARILLLALLKCVPGQTTSSWRMLERCNSDPTWTCWFSLYLNKTPRQCSDFTFGFPGALESGGSSSSCFLLCYR